MAAQHAIGDTLWFMNTNKPVEADVNLIHEDVVTDSEGVTTSYSYRMEAGESLQTKRYGFVAEDKLFASKADLLDSL